MIVGWHLIRWNLELLRIDATFRITAGQGNKPTGEGPTRYLKYDDHIIRQSRFRGDLQSNSDTPARIRHLALRDGS